MILHARDYRRLINRFIIEGQMDCLVGGGMILTMDGANFTISEVAIWKDIGNKKEFITNNVMHGRGWRINLLDTPDGGKGRMLTEVHVKGNRQKARRDLLFALNYVYR